MPFQQIWGKIDPRKLFLVDGIGALITAIMLGLILARFENTFGMPQRVLYSLAFIASIFSIYSFVCFLSKTGNWRPFMKIIATANLLYCCLTIGLIIYLYPQLTVLGLLYFVLEIFVVIALALIELKIASNTIFKKETLVMNKHLEF